MSAAFRVVVAGRPNVGKSALVNRLLRRRRSIVHDKAGMTRDVLDVEAKLPDGRTYRLLDTGGYDPEGREKIPAAVREKALGSIRSADLVLLVVDASAGILPGDRSAARVVREAGVESVVVANKIDRREGSEGEVEAWELGFPEVYGVSAEHGIGIDELVEAIAGRMPAPSQESAGEGESEEEKRPSEVRLAVVGRPNVGKSSLVNALLGEDRTIVSEIPGTTRDAVDVLLERGGRRFRLVDTAGIRRRAKTERGPEVLSVVQARKRIEECDVALLVLDAVEGPTGQDAAVAAHAHESGKGLVIVANKWDLAGPASAEASKALEAAVRDRMPFAGYAEILRVSARTGRGIGRILAVASRAAENRRRRIPTGELNRVLGRPLRDSPPRTARGTRLRIYYVAQTDVAPPTFTLVCNREEPLHFSESRRIENLLRGSEQFAGSPIRISVRGRSREHARGRTKSR
ncbi:MAG TPA: ribosome biogenesis GTPase Der [Thermoanaerobaculia bacterium]|nr:ribosome biogenesis GTPase Der [Thermoanaerobaculia bacterium]